VEWLALIVGIGLVLYPEPVTTATGLGIISGSLGYNALNEG
jgi:hypothetical protein